MKTTSDAMEGDLKLELNEVMLFLQNESKHIYFIIDVAYRTCLLLVMYPEHEDY
jgi:hypothetical protein